MKKIISALILVAMLTGLVGCSWQIVQDEGREDIPSMFVCVETTANWMVVYHKETRVMYAVSYGGYNIGNFTVLINADGTPMLYEGKEEAE